VKLTSHKIRTRVSIIELIFNDLIIFVSYTISFKKMFYLTKAAAKAKAGGSITVPLTCLTGLESAV
jgi:hypothetical protein